jgi:hypothetical protein
MKGPVKYPVLILLGSLFGILVILPVNEFTSFFQYHRDEGITVWRFMGKQLFRAYTFQMPYKLGFYLLTGVAVGILAALLTAWNSSHLSATITGNKRLTGPWKVSSSKPFPDS